MQIDHNSYNHELGDFDGNAIARPTQRKAHASDIKEVVEKLSVITTMTLYQIDTYVLGSFGGGNFDDSKGNSFAPDPVTCELIQTIHHQLREAKIYLTV
jgi:hypothetical protein